MSYEQILYAEDGPIGTITLNRPDDGNMFTAKMCLEIRDCIEAIRQETRTRVIVLTGAGDRFFCIGGRKEGLDDTLALADSFGIDEGVAEPASELAFAHGGAAAGQEGADQGAVGLSGAEGLEDFEGGEGGGVDDQVLSGVEASRGLEVVEPAVVVGAVGFAEVVEDAAGGLEGGVVVV